MPREAQAAWDTCPVALVRMPRRRAVVVWCVLTAAALLAMLNSCAAGVSVVNIDNGFGAGYAAAQINRWNEDDEREGRE